MNASYSLQKWLTWPADDEKTIPNNVASKLVVIFRTFAKLHNNKNRLLSNDVLTWIRMRISPDESVNLQSNIISIINNPIDLNRNFSGVDHSEETKTWNYANINYCENITDIHRLPPVLLDYDSERAAANACAALFNMQTRSSRSKSPTRSYQRSASTTRVSQQTSRLKGVRRRAQSIVISSQTQISSNNKLASFQAAAAPTQFDRVIWLMQRVFELLERNQFTTKRGLYYMAADALFANEQRHCDATISTLCRLLREPRHRLHILASTKGLIAGPLQYVTEKQFQMISSKIAAEDEICFNDHQPDAVRRLPSLPQAITHFLTNAKFVLIVEKQSIFQQLLSANITERLNCIMITACGYPDLDTRIFLKKLTLAYPDLPLYVLVDGDPHGIDILLTYRGGSTSGATHVTASIGDADDDFDTERRQALAIPRLRWLGIFPHEFQFGPERFQFGFLTCDADCLVLLDQMDQKKARDLLYGTSAGAQYVQEHKQLLGEVKLFCPQQDNDNHEPLNIASVKTSQKQAEQTTTADDDDDRDGVGGGSQRRRRSQPLRQAKLAKLQVRKPKLLRKRIVGPFKCELEALNNYAVNFITNYYIPKKLANKMWIELC